MTFAAQQTAENEYCRTLSLVLADKSRSKYCTPIHASTDLQFQWPSQIEKLPV